ncbi:MAG: response regulator transcription factor [Actinomycetota bacterium]|nr:response regulator transcription factor [Actinomycetota bacterium]
MARLLVVEDDEEIGRALETALLAHGHEVSWQRTGASAVAEGTRTRFELVLLDLGLPDADGIDVCRSLKRTQPDAVVVMLTARRDEMDVIVGLESGADDYLFKPFRMTELLARVRAHLRRTEPGTADNDPEPDLTAGDLVLDRRARRTTVGGAELPLRRKEFDLLARLMSDVGVAVSREHLMADVWDENWFGSTKTLDVHIAALRQRLAEAADRTEPPARIPQITTLRAHGYRLEPPSAR